VGQNMKINLLKIIILSLVLTGFFSSYAASSTTNRCMISKLPKISENSASFEDYIDITAAEAWNFLNNLDDGIQIPIDVRTDSEWVQNHIDTTFPQHPRHHCSCEWGDPSVLEDFITLYEGKEIILYCKAGGRSSSAANTLVDNNFNGVIYNMLGGITSWENNGYPTIGNRPPEAPQISGLSTGQAGIDYNFTISTNDPDWDNVYYYIDWGDGNSEIYQEAYESGEEVNFTHNWDSSGLFNIEVKARDPYFEQSELQTFLFTISSTELEISDIREGFGEITVDIKNIGDFTVENITLKINVNGGFFSKINLNHECNGSNCKNFLEPNEIKTASTMKSGFIFGLGPIEIIVIVEAKNAVKVTATENGFVIGPFIMIG
jgi:rhodanese-related sulfurtransferase